MNTLVIVDPDQAIRERLSELLAARLGVAHEHHAALGDQKARRVPALVGMVAGGAQKQESHHFTS